MGLSFKEWSLECRKRAGAPNFPDSLVRWFPHDVSFMEQVGFNFSSDLGVSELTFLHRTNSVGFQFENSVNLTKISFPFLTDVAVGNGSGGVMDISNHSNLTTVELPRLQHVNGEIVIAQNPKLTSLVLTDLILPSAGLACNANTLLTSISMPSLTLVPGSDFGLLSFLDCALDQASVDGILTRLAVVTSFTDGNINLSGGTNAIPSAAGLTAKAVLEGRGVTVAVNS